MSNMSECAIVPQAVHVAAEPTVLPAEPTVLPPTVKATLDTPFDAIPVSTQTIIGTTNLRLDVLALYNALELEQYAFAPRRRGRRPKDMTVCDKQPMALHDGAIITVKYGPEMRGAQQSPSVSPQDDTPSSGESIKFFRNALTVVMFSHGKLVNFKISRNGKLQFTGAKSVDYAITCVKHLWAQLLRLDSTAKADGKPIIIAYTDAPDTIVCEFDTVMTNLDFRIGHEIDRAKLNDAVANVDGYHSFTETTFGYSGLNLKMPCENENTTPVPVLTITADGTCSLSEHSPNPAPGRARHTTFLVFKSGSVIVSGTNRDTIRPCFQKFAKFVRENRTRIENIST